MLVWGVLAFLVFIVTLCFGFSLGMFTSIAVYQKREALKPAAPEQKPQVDVSAHSILVPSIPHDIPIANVPRDVLGLLDYRMPQWPPQMLADLLDKGVIKISNNDRNKAVISEWP